MRNRFRRAAASLGLVFLLLLAPPPACAQPELPTPDTGAAPDTQAAPKPDLGVLLLDDRWIWEARRQERWSSPRLPGLVTDWKALLAPEVAGHLTPEQQALLLSDPRRLLASRHSAALFRPHRLLLIGPEVRGRVSSLQVDLLSGARQPLEAPSGLKQEKAREVLTRQCLEGRGPEPVPVVANPESRLFHHPQAAHLSPRAESLNLPDRSQAEKQGYRPCPICFPEANRLVQQDETERELARYAASMVENRYRVSQDAEEQRRVKQVGERLMEANHIEDRGYRILVLDSDDLNAFSAPTGPLYITSGLLRVLESPDELAAVLAHELGHAERHHMLQQYNRSRWSGMLGSILGYATRSYWGRVAGNVLSDTWTNGYSRDFELEADREAVLLTYAAGYRSEDFILTLTKLAEFSRQMGEFQGPDWFRTHPSSEGRVRQIREVLQKLAPLEQRASALQTARDGELAAFLRRRAREYLESPGQVQAFLDAYEQLRFPQDPEVPTEAPPQESPPAATPATPPPPAEVLPPQVPSGSLQTDA